MDTRKTYVNEWKPNKKHKLTRKAGPKQRGKKCWGKCGLRLTLKSFDKNVCYEDGLKSYCRDCSNAYRRDHKETYKESSERYRLLHGETRTYRTTGWKNRYAELRATGRVTTAKRRRAVKDRANMRLVCGELIICKPRKTKRRCQVRRPKE